jgi:hypothetical protein
MNAINPLYEIRDVVEEFDGSGIVASEHTLDQCRSATADRALPAAFDTFQLPRLGINPVVQSDKFIIDFLEQLQCFVIKIFHIKIFQ